MKTLAVVRARFEQLLEFVVVLLMMAIAVIIILGFMSRLVGHPYSWTGEASATLLAWLTYYGGALAASKGAHITVPNLVNTLPVTLRVPIALLSEAITIAFFVLLAWTGLQVVIILKGSTLISLPWISQQLTQSVIPIASGLFVIAELLRLPVVLDEARGRGLKADDELEETVPQAIDTAGTATGREER